jgi:hypothetical protein
MKLLSSSSAKSGPASDSDEAIHKITAVSRGGALALCSLAATSLVVAAHNIMGVAMTGKNDGGCVLATAFSMSAHASRLSRFRQSRKNLGSCIDRTYVQSSARGMAASWQASSALKWRLMAVMESYS